MSNCFFGTGVALVTPFKEDLRIDEYALGKITEFVIKNGIDYVVVLGTTAEVSTLSEKEKEIVINTVLETNNNRVPTVIGLGGNNTSACVDAFKAVSSTKFEAVLSVAPYYTRPSQKGLYLHYKALAEATELPLIVYNVPSRTSCNILPQTTIQLAKDVKNIIGIKEAAGDLVQVMELIRTKPKDFLIISGDDITALPSVCAGGAGVISVLANALPEAFSTMIKLGLDNRNVEAYTYQYTLMDVMRLNFEEINPTGIKGFLSVLGLCSDRVRLPLVPISADLKSRIELCFKSLSLPKPSHS